MAVETLEQMNGGEFRYYRFTDRAGKQTDLLSVTSIRNLCGVGYQLVRWQLANLADAALGTMKRTVVGPRGGISEKRQVWEAPSEFARMYAEAIDEEEGQQARVDALRRWLTDQSEEPRNIAAVRGTLVHEAIERNVAWDRIERPYVESAFAGLTNRDRKKVKRAVNDEDVDFIRHSVRQYWAMRESTPMVLLAREVRVVNLEVGYAGTFDALAWLLGNFVDGEFIPLSPAKQALARSLKAERVTVADVARVGGILVLLDWKTAKGIHTDYVTQTHAYLAAEFAFVGGSRDERVTALLNAALFGGLVHIRPNMWALHLFEYEDEAVRAFLGSVAFARFLAKHPEPDAIFKHTFRGVSEETDEEVAA
jgi:hypothetical protein